MIDLKIGWVGKRPVGERVVPDTRSHGAAIRTHRVFACFFLERLVATIYAVAIEVGSFEECVAVIARTVRVRFANQRFELSQQRHSRRAVSIAASLHCSDQVLDRYGRFGSVSVSERRRNGRRFCGGCRCSLRGRHSLWLCR